MTGRGLKLAPPSPRRGISRLALWQCIYEHNLVRITVGIAVAAEGNVGYVSTTVWSSRAPLRGITYPEYGAHSGVALPGVT